MKKLLTISLILSLFTSVAFAQNTGDRFRRLAVRDGIRSGQLSRTEILEIRKDQFRYNRLERRSRRDGVITPMERRRLHKAKAHNRREMIRMKHNRRHRVI